MTNVNLPLLSEYVFHLRKEVVTAQETQTAARETQTAADAEIAQLQGIIAGLQTNLGFCSAEITRLQGLVAEKDDALEQSMRSGFYLQLSVISSV